MGNNTSNSNNSKLNLSAAENLLLGEIRESKSIIQSTNSQVTDLSLRMTKLEVIHTNLGCKLDTHIKEHSDKRNIIFASVISFISAVFMTSYNKILGLFK